MSAEIDPDGLDLGVAVEADGAAAES